VKVHRLAACVQDSPTRSRTCCCTCRPCCTFVGCCTKTAIRGGTNLAVRKHRKRGSQELHCVVASSSRSLVRAFSKRRVLGRISLRYFIKRSRKKIVFLRVQFLLVLTEIEIKSEYVQKDRFSYSAPCVCTACNLLSPPPWRHDQITHTSWLLHINNQRRASMASPCMKRVR
jgi:hypothetical protein